MINLYNCLVTEATDNGDGTHHIAVERPLVGAEVRVPFEFNYPTGLMSDRVVPGETINLDIDETTREVKA